MAKLDINLVPQEITKQFRIKERRRSFNFLGIAAFGVILFLTGALLLVRITLNRSHRSLLVLKQQEERKIKDLQVVEGKALELERKVTSLGSIFEERRHYSYLLDVLSESTPEGVIATSLAVGLGSEIGLEGEADSYVALAKFLVSLLEEDLGGKLFSQMELKAAGLDERTGKIRFTLTLNLKEGGLAFK